MWSTLYLAFLLLAAIAAIVLATTRWKWHPFIVLLCAALGYGLAAGLTPGETIGAATDGFGGTLRYIGIVIACGTVIGTILEKSGGALVMAQTVVGWVGTKRADLAMGATGAVVSVPVFCDSGFIILAPLIKSLARQTGRPLATFAVALSMGLYTTHVFVPPTPGPIAAAGELGADIGMVILFGISVTIPVLFATYLFARWAGRDVTLDIPDSETSEPDTSKPTTQLPSPVRAFTPVLLPVLLIACQSIAELPSRPIGEGMLFRSVGFVGDPNIALLLGVLLAVFLLAPRGSAAQGDWVAAALKQAGPILLITGAGGAFGSILRATPFGERLGAGLSAVVAGAFALLLLFAVAAAFKTALGSSTVAIITTASICAPLLGSLGLASPTAVVLATLAIGAGAMTVSHANDSYFWVVSQFTGMTVAQAYRLQTLGSLVAGLTGIFIIVILGIFLI